MRLRHSICIWILAAPLSIAAADLAEEANAVLQENCRMCHGAAMQQSGLDLRTRAGILQGGERGPAVTGANPKRSWLWKLTTHQTKPSMPPGRKLPDEQIEVLRKWIMAGAPMPKSAVSDEEAERLAALKKLEERPISDEERQWWAFRKPVRPAVPGGKENAVDGFLAAALREKGLQPGPRADKRTLVRRVYLDLIGLPPSPEETRAFLADDAPDAWERLVESLLALAALRRALGAALARPGALRRLRRLRARLRLAHDVALPRLRRRCVQ